MAGRILVVDPDVRIADAFAMTFRRHGYEALVASQECDCLRHMCESAPNALVLEPDTNGGWGFRMLRREDPRLPALPTVVVSRRNSEPAIQESNRFICGWYVKPVEPRVLIFAVKQALAHPSQ